MGAPRSWRQRRTSDLAVQGRKRVPHGAPRISSGISFRIALGPKVAFTGGLEFNDHRPDHPGGRARGRKSATAISTLAMIDSRDFLAASRRAENEVLLPADVYGGEFMIIA